MSTIASGLFDSHADEVSPDSDVPFLVSLPDAERLMLQSRFVRNQFEAVMLSDLEASIRTAKLLDPSAVPPYLVTMNSRVVLRDVGSGCQRIFTLVFPSCANARAGKVSILSTLGSILLGARTGQKLTCPISGLVATVVVEAILHQPEAAGDYYG
ncbi:MAG: GreA/GreB family elongation factor [Nitrospirota bacterium]